MKTNNEIMLNQLFISVCAKLDYIKKYKNGILSKMMPSQINAYVDKKEKDLMVDFLQLDLFISERNKLKQRLKVDLS